MSALIIHDAPFAPRDIIIFPEGLALFRAQSFFAEPKLLGGGEGNC